MRILLLSFALLSLAAAPAAAREQAPPAGAAEADPLGRQAAERLVDLIWPEDMMRRLMDAAGISTSTEAMMGIRAGDVLSQERLAESGVDPDATMAEVAERADPHFRERMRITTEVMQRQMTEFLVREEPRLKRLMADAYARRFTVDELEELIRFFGTPTAQKYVAESADIISDPAYVQSNQEMIGRLAQALPGMLAAAREATAHLPPPPRQEDD